MPQAPMTAANAAACTNPIRPAGSGLLQVLDIIWSLATSYIWFSVLAQAAHPNVPKEVNRKPIQSMLLPLPATNPAPAVITTRELSLNLESCL
mmetsp:Transcript_6356/g.14077  ORF Transcript_6356/g.14077 Transcript_6356/m.14077 type:complete len:93 (-) Transcript_6356:546-824(-)